MHASRQTLVFRAETRQGSVPADWKFAAQLALKLSRFSWVLAAVSSQGAIPGIFKGFAAADGLAPVVVCVLGNLEVAIAPVEGFTGQFGFFSADSSSMNAGRICLIGGAVADRGGHLDQAGLVGDGLCLLNRLGNSSHIAISIGHVLHMPAVGLIALQHVLGEGHGSVAVDGDVVVVVEGNQLAQAQVAGQGGGFTAHPFLVAAITHDHVGVVINQLAAGPVEFGSQVRFGDRQAHGVGDALAQLSGGDFNPWGFECFRVTRGAAAPLAELLDVFDAHRVVAAEVQQRVKQHAAVAS